MEVVGGGVLAGCIDFIVVGAPGVACLGEGAESRVCCGYCSS